MNGGSRCGQQRDERWCRRALTWNKPSQSQASEMSLVLRSTGSSLIISISGGSDMGVPVGAPLPSSMIPAEHAIRLQSMFHTAVI